MNLALVKLASVLSLVAAVVLGVSALAERGAVVSRSLGLRGLRRMHARRDSPLFARLEPLLEWLGGRVAPFLTLRARAALDRTLTLSGEFWGLAPEEFVAFSLGSALLAAGLGLFCTIALHRGPIYPIATAILGAMLPYLELSGRADERRQHIERTLPTAIDLLALSLSAGLDFVGGLRQLVQRSSQPNDPLVEELSLILRELELGKTRRFAVMQFAERVPTPFVREFVFSIVQAEEQGNPLGRVIEIQAQTLRGRRSVRAEEAAAKASVKMMLPMVLLFIAVLLLIAAPMAFDIVGRFRK